jgi:hypothetical protein
MTHEASDLLHVYLLAREAGLVRGTPDGLVCEMPVTPLFETVEDLENSGRVLADFLAHPMTMRTLRRLHPDSLPEVAAFIRRDPLLPLRERVLAALRPPCTPRPAGPRRVLHLVHGWPKLEYAWSTWRLMRPSR